MSETFKKARHSTRLTEETFMSFYLKKFETYSTTDTTQKQPLKHLSF